MSSSSPPTQIIFPDGHDSQPNLSGLSRPPDSFSTSIPSPGPPIKNFLTQLPGSQSEAKRSAIRSYTGASQSQNKIVYNIFLGQWAEYPYHLELFEGQPVFSLTSHHHEFIRTTPLLNLRHVNTMHQEGYDMALSMLNSSEVLSQNYMTAEEFTRLTRTPTCMWSGMSFMRNLLSDETKRGLHGIRYLYEEGMRDQFNFYGWALGQISEELQKKITAVSRKGCIDSVENCWGDELQPGDKVYFIFKRKNLGEGRWGAFAYHPWYGSSPPTMADSEYVDLTGHIRYGQVIYVGSVDRWVEEYNIDDDILQESVGFATPTSERTRYRPEPGCIRITASSRPGIRIPWSF